MYRFFFFGGLFGFALSRAGATDYDRITDMFLLRDLHLVGVIAIAIGVAGLGFELFRRSERASWLVPKPTRPGNLWGGLLFGVGWALTGTCPGTALSQVGEGKLTALATVAGILLGVQIYRWIGERVQRRLPWSGGSGR